MKTFNDLGLSTPILMAISSQGFINPTEIQEKTIPSIIAGKDILARSETGSGKTLAFGLPLLDRIDEYKGVESIIICPTRELAMQITEEMNKIACHMQEVKVLAIYGGSDMGRQIKGIKSKTNIVVGTPGRVCDHIRRKSLRLETVSTVVLDEADEMLNMGFHDDLEAILSSCSHKAQTLMFSATMPKQVKILANNYLKEPEVVEIGDNNKSVATIKQYYAYTKNKEEFLLELIRSFENKKVIVFTNTKRKAQELSDDLSKNKIHHSVLHGDMHQNERRREITDMKNDKSDILVATDVAARGIDLPDIDYIINFDLPINTEYYVHRIGRTARAGKEGASISLVSTKLQNDKIRLLENVTQAKIYEIKLVNSKLVQSDYVEQISKNEKRSSFTKNKNRDDDKKNYDTIVKYDRNNFSGDKNSSGDKKPYDDKPRYDENKSFGNKRSFENRKPYDKTNRTFDDSKKPYDKTKRTFDDSRKPYEKDNRTFEDNREKPYGEKRTYDNKPKKSYDFKFKRTFDDKQLKDNPTKKYTNKSENSFSFDKKSPSKDYGDKTFESKKPYDATNKKPYSKFSNKKSNYSNKKYGPRSNDKSDTKYTSKKTKSFN